MLGMGAPWERVGIRLDDGAAFSSIKEDFLELMTESTKVAGSD